MTTETLIKMDLGILHVCTIEMRILHDIDVDNFPDELSDWLEYVIRIGIEERYHSPHGLVHEKWSEHPELFNSLMHKIVPFVHGEEGQPYGISRLFTLSGKTSNGSIVFKNGKLLVRWHSLVILLFLYGGVTNFFINYPEFRQGLILFKEDIFKIASYIGTDKIRYINFDFPDN